MHFQRDSRSLFFSHRFQANGERRELVARREQCLLHALPIGNVHRIADNPNWSIGVIPEPREGKLGKSNFPGLGPSTNLDLMGSFGFHRVNDLTLEELTV